MAKQTVDNQQLLNIQKRIESIPPTALARELQNNAQALVKQPKNAALNFGVGLLYARLGDVQSAVTVLKKALKLAKDNTIVLGALAFVHANLMRDHKGALTYLDKVCNLNLTDGVARMLKANSLMETGKLPEALETLKQAEALVTGNHKLRLLAMRSQCLQRMGNFGTARAELESIAHSDPNGMISVADTMSRLPGNTPEQIEELRSILQDALEKDSPAFRDTMHKATSAVALGNIFQDRGEFDEAFHWFRKAKELQPRDQNAWSYKETKEFEILKRVFDKNLYDKLPAGHPSDRQIFVVGMPRSGTTLLESILGAHELVEDHGELEFFIQQQHQMGITAVKSPEVEQHANQISQMLLSAPKNGFVDIGKAYIDRHGFNRDPSLFRVDKLPHNFRALGLIAATFPNARIIHAKRHPMDICLSNFQNLLPGYNTTFGQDLTGLAEFYKEYSDLMAHWRSILPVEILDVKYENLVADVETEAGRIFNFCGIEWNPVILENRSAKQDANTASMWQVRQDIYQSSVSKWKRYEKHLKPLAEVLKDDVTRYEQA